MREILFRGQTRRKGEKVRMDGSPVESNWVYGGVLCGSGDHSIIYQTEPDIEKKVVYTDTLGQYTGLTDKNGVKVFEGDIVRNIESGTKALVQFFPEHGAYMAWIRNESFSINQVEYLGEIEMPEIEVIGNIYDNPELIGGEQNDN